MWWGHDGGDGWWWFWMGMMMVFVWLPLLVALIWALRQFGGPGQAAAPPQDRRREPSALDLARRAYARGDLDRERYLQIIEDLEETEEEGDAARPVPERPDDSPGAIDQTGSR